MSWTWEQILEQTTPPEESARICLRGDLVAAKEAAEADMVAARAKYPDPTVGEGAEIYEAAQRVRDLEAQCDDAAITFRFRAIGRQRKADLVAAHPPTDEQQQEARDNDIRYLWNPKTFPPALVAASCYEPDGLTLTTAKKIFDEWGDGPWMQLWRACLAANEGVADPGPKSVIASAVLRDSAPKSD